MALGILLSMHASLNLAAETLEGLARGACSQILAAAL
jgi:hypothetical protein